jgi:hypothetical protein
VRDTADPGLTVTARKFDPWYYLGVSVLASTAVPLVWHKKLQKGEPYFRVMLGTPAGHEAQDGIPVARLIADTPAGVETRFLRSHYDLRRAALTLRSGINRPYPPKFTRADIIALVDAAHLPLLTRALDVADRMHEKLYALVEAD